MKRWQLVALLILLAAVWGAVGALALSDTPDYRIVPNKKFRQPVPPVNFNASQQADLKAQKPVCLLLPSPVDPELMAGFMAAVLPYDPVTVWWIIQDIRHFHLVDPSYPRNGSLTKKRRTFMPYVFDGAACEYNGSIHLYQMLVMPLVAPRVYSLNRYHNRDGFPWESAWRAMGELVCSENRNHELDNFFNDAVQIKHNNGCWHISPVPEKYRNGPQDALLTYFEYYVDTNPGGNIGKIKKIVNQATATALPAVHKNLMFHGKHWAEHMKKYHSAADQAQYDRELAAFRQAMGQ